MQYRKNILVWVLFLLLSYFLFAGSIGLRLNSNYIGPYGHDQISFIWALYWWPYTLIHHQFSFTTSAIWHPIGESLVLAPASVMSLSLLAFPITELLGPVASFNLIIVFSNAISAFCMYLIIKRITKSTIAGVVGWYIFAFSTYQFVQVVHLNLETTCFIPLLCLFFILFWEKKLKWFFFIPLVSAILIIQFLASTELFLTWTIFLGVSGVGCLLLYPGRIKQILPLLACIVIAYGITGAILFPYIHTAMHVGIPTQQLNDPAYYSTDLLNLIIPTTATHVGGRSFNMVSSSFLGNVYENSGYLSLPLILIIVIYTIRYWKERLTWVILIPFLVLLLLSLGPVLHIAGYYSIQLPEVWLLNHQYVNQLLPERLSVYTFLCAAFIAGLWTAKKELLPWCKYLLVCATIVFLFPNIQGDTSHTQTNIPQFFATKLYRKYINNGDNVLFFPYGGFGDSMLYQVNTAMYFNLAEGYIAPWILTPLVYLNSPLTQAFQQMELDHQPIIPSTQNDLIAYIKQFHITTVIVRKDHYPLLRRLLATLKIQPISIDQFMIYNIR